MKRPKTTDRVKWSVLPQLFSHKSVWFGVADQKSGELLVESPKLKFNKPWGRTERLCVAGKKVRTRNRSRHQNVSWLYKWLLNDTLSETQSSLWTQWGPYDVSQPHGRVSMTALPTGWPQDTAHQVPGRAGKGAECWSFVFFFVFVLLQDVMKIPALLMSQHKQINICAGYVQ